MIYILEAVITTLVVWWRQLVEPNQHQHIDAFHKFGQALKVHGKMYLNSSKEKMFILNLR